MNLYDYVYASDGDKTKWLDSIRIVSGLPYFGGKQFIGRYLLNHIFNMASRMYMDGKKADIFVDAFGGGGKIALSVPEGWFKEIVLNDINYGVYSYFECCRDNPGALVRMIGELGGVMSREMFDFCVENRNNDNGGGKTEPLVSAAMTYWATAASLLGIAKKGKAHYNLGSGEKEKEEIRNIAGRAEKTIGMIHDKMKRLNITVERLDYKELIKKYNGKTYQEQDKKENTEEQFARYNKLWYFDPPYHPATLSGGKAAPYENTFEIKQTMEMTELLHGDKADEYSEIGYFIKSDYDPKDIYEHAEDKTVIQQYFHDFDVLEDNIEWPGHKANTENPIFYKMFLGEFYKGDDDGMGGRLKGREYIWCRGNYIPGT